MVADKPPRRPRKITEAQVSGCSYLENVSTVWRFSLALLTSLVCQLHGGDIGVSSKEGEGSTFGFFFKVRRSDGVSENGRPPFQSRTSSETSQASTRDQSIQRPSYSRSNSHLTQIKERPNERPSTKTLTSHSGVALKSDDDIFTNPPTERRPESHPESSGDPRYKETQDIAKDIQPERSAVSKAIEDKLPNLQRGETHRQASAADDTSRSQSKESADNKQTLLLVEDNLINQKVLRRQLQTRGFEVFTANNGQEAIDAVAERGRNAGDDPCKHNYFDVILMDQEMPVKDGNAATQEIRQLQEEGKAGYSHILGVSANVREAQTRSMREAGMDDIISKPFKVEDLLTRIRAVIDKTEKDKEKSKKGPPAIDTLDNDEVRMLEDVPIRTRSEQKRADGDAVETAGKAKIQIGSEAKKENIRSASGRPDESVESPDDTPGHDREEKNGEKDRDEKAKQELDDAKKEMSTKKDDKERYEERERAAGKAGKLSGREGESRGGERSRSRHMR